MTSFTITSLLFASTLLLPISAFPTLTKRATVNPPKIGYELECRQLNWVNTNTNDLTAAGITNTDLKGKALLLPNIENKAEWKPTAEIFHNDASQVTTEVIIDGGSATSFRGVPLVAGGDVGARLGKEIFTWITSATNLWKDGGAASQAQIDGFTDLDPELHWELEESGQKLTVDRLTWGLQVTAPFPLGRLLRIIPSITNEAAPERSELVPNPKFKMIDSCYFPYQGTTTRAVWEDAEITDDVRVYVSLVMAYIKAGKSSNLADGPKHAISIMPRTDFKAMYRELVKGKIDGIVKEMSNKNGYWNREHAAKGKDHEGTTITDFTSWMYAICVTTETCENPAPKSDAKPSKWAKKTSDFTNIQIAYKSNNPDKPFGPTVKEWLDGIADGKPGVDAVTAADEEYRGGQVGSLKDTFEHAIGNEKKKLAIFEFRDITGQTTDKLEDWLGKVEAEIRDAHSGHRNAGKRAVATKPKKDDKKKGKNPGCIKIRKVTSTSTSATSSATSTQTPTSRTTSAAATTTPATTTPTPSTTATPTTKAVSTPKVTPATNTKVDELEKKRQELLDRKAANEAAKNNHSQKVDTKIDEKNEKDGKKKVCFHSGTPDLEALLTFS